MVRHQPEKIPSDAPCFICIYSPPDHRAFPCKECVPPEYEQCIRDTLTLPREGHDDDQS